MADDRRITLAALVVSGVIGVASPLIAWRASLDSQRTAAESAETLQRASAAEERARTDVAELRAILDRALVDLNNLQVQASRKNLRWRNPSNSDEVVDEAQAALTDAFFKARADDARLLIRVGTGTLYDSYNDAIYIYGRVGKVTAENDSPIARQSAGVKSQVEDLLSSGEDEGDEFKQSAYDMVHSRLK